MIEFRDPARVTPFRVSIEQPVLDDLARRLDAVRWPVPPPGGPWDWGTDQAFLRTLTEHWRHRFDWRGWETRLNAHAQYQVKLDGGTVHILIEPGSGDAPLPVILSHGWPGSVFELIELVEPLAHPERFGGNAADGLTVVLPSLPGFGFSPAPDRVLAPRDVAAMWHQLMHDVLGFDRYGAHGGDIGASITGWLGLDHPESVVGIHLNNAVLRAQWSFDERPADPEEAAHLDARLARMKGGTAYQHAHAEKPATIGFGLSDSPVALAAWIAEKYHDWTIPGEDRAPPLDIDHMVANIMAYWVGTLQPVHWMYQALFDGGSIQAPAGRTVEVPAGFYLSPGDSVVVPPRQWLERTYDVRRYVLAESGGHFPGIEQPAALATEISAFFARLPR